LVLAISPEVVGVEPTIKKGEMAMKQYTLLSLGRRTLSIAQGLTAHARLVPWVVRRQWLGALAFGEALQVGRIALWRALEGFDPHRGTRFSTYAVPIIAREIWRAVAQAAPDPREVLMPEPPREAAVDLDEAVHGALVREAVGQLLLSLPPRLAHVLVARYGLGGGEPLTFAAIGAELGVSRQRAQQLHVEALMWCGHPARSLALRKLLDRNTGADYRAFLLRLRRWQRARRGKR
jgi:RNA polymerase sigma factor (sigma-70 family)